MRYFKFITTGMLAFIVLALTIACSKDDHEENEPAYIIPYVEGKLNNMPIKIWDQNALIYKSYVRYTIVGTGDDKRLAFNWELKLIENKDSVVTMIMHLNDLRGSGAMIYHPNSTPSSCHIEVRHLQSNDTTFYYSAPKNPTHVKWETFTASYKTKVEKYKDLTLTYRPHEWPGIDGIVESQLIADKPHKATFNIKLAFKLY